MSSSGLLESQSVLVEDDEVSLRNFQVRLSALNKKAQAYGLDPISIDRTERVRYKAECSRLGRDGDWVARSIVPAKPGEHVERPVQLVRFDLSFPIVKMGDWAVVGKLDRLEDGETLFPLVASRDQADAAQVLGYKKLCCEHCGSNRRRNSAFILRDLRAVEPTYKEVGTSCLEDFTGIDPAVALFLVKLYEAVRVAEGDEAGEPGERSWRSNAIDTGEFLARVAFLVSPKGDGRFIGSAKASETGDVPTYVLASYNWDGMLQHDEVTKDRWLASRAECLAKSREVREWIAAQPPDGRGFMVGVQALVAQESLNIRKKRHLAFAAAAIPTYHRARSSDVDRAVSHHFGSRDEKMQRELQVQHVNSFPGQFGTTWSIVMKDVDGNVARWVTGSPPAWVAEGCEGRFMSASFTVRDHGEYQGTQQTNILRLKVKTWIDAFTATPESRLAEAGELSDAAAVEEADEAGSTACEAPSC